MRKVEKQELEKPEVANNGGISKQKEGWYIFFVVLLSVLFLASIGLFLKNPLVPNAPEHTGLKPLGTDMQLTITDNGSISQTLYFYGSFLPNFGVNQLASVSLKPTERDAKLRAKAFLYDEYNNLVSIPLETTTEWAKKNDGYYYYNDTLTPNLTVQFIKKISTPTEDAKLSSNNIYLIIITFETLPADSNFESIWKIENL